MQRLPLEGAGDESARKAFAGARRLGQVEVPALSLRQRRQPRKLLAILQPELLAREPAHVVHPAQEDERADLEAPRQALQLLEERRLSPIFVAERGERDEDL